MPIQIDPRLLTLATPEEAAFLEKSLRLEQALLSPADYAEYCWRDFVRPRHIELLNESIVRGTEGKLLRADGQPMRGMIVTMPPRHGKSELISKFTPAWYLTRYPDKRVVVTSYSSDFAETWG